KPISDKYPEPDKVDGSELAENLVAEEKKDVKAGTDKIRKELSDEEKSDDDDREGSEKPGADNPEQAEIPELKADTEVVNIYTEKTEPNIGNEENNEVSEENMTEEVQISSEKNTDESNVDINRLNSMLNQVEKLQKEKITKNSELEVKKQELDTHQVKQITEPAEVMHKEKLEKILILPADVKSVNDVLDIFSNGLLFSLDHTLESLGSSVDIIEPSTVIETFNKHNIKSDDIKPGSMIFQRIVDDLEPAYVVFMTFEEIGSRYIEYWRNHIIGDDITKMIMGEEDDSYLLAKVDSSLDVTSLDFLDTNDVGERVELALPFYEKGIEYMGKDNYKDAYVQFRIAHAIAPDSDRYDFGAEMEKGRKYYLMAFNRQADDFLQKIRFRLTLSVLDSSGDNLDTFKYNINAEDFDDIFSGTFRDLKSLLGTDGEYYSDYNYFNGHARDFHSSVYLYRAIEYLFSREIDKEGFDRDISRNSRARTNAVKNELNQALSEYRDFTLPYVILSQMYLEENNTTESIRNLRLAMDREPQRLSLKYQVALLEERLGNRETALNLYNEISMMREKTVYRKIMSESVTKVAVEFFGAGEFQKSIDKCDFALKYNYSEKVHFIRTVSQYHEKENSEALKNIRILRENDTEDIVLMAFHSRLLFENGSKQKALSLAKEVLEGWEKRKDSVFSTAGVYELKKEEFLFMCGEIYESLSNNNLARSYYKQVIAVAPYSEIAGKAKNRLASL
ncbi:MAG: tetratricopeptide repeat protein, partial [Candidatus Muiribacteriaceae bacterium]